MGSAVSCPSVTITLTVMVVAVGMYIGWPCPAFSENLLKWRKEDSSYFTSKGRKVFYKGTICVIKLIHSSRLPLK